MLEIEIIEVSVTQMGFALMLKPPTREKVVPIFIGPLETYSISSALEGQKFERPLTHDLLKTILKSIDHSIEKIYIDDFRSGTFFAKLYIEAAAEPGNYIEIDSRPSDAIALALRFKAPIFMAEHVYEQTAIDISLLKEKVKGNDLLSSDESLADEEKDELIQSIIDEFGEPPELPIRPGKKSVKEAESEKASETGAEFKSREEVLKQMLNVAISQENYEEAARLRDEISQLAKSGQGKDKGIE